MKIATATDLVTPKEPCRLGGYGMRQDQWKKVMHELKCTAIVLEIEQETVIFCDAEVLSIPEPRVQRIKDRLQEEFNINPDLVTIGAVHTHAGPLMEGSDFGAEEAAVKAYGDYLENRIFEIIVKALLLERIPVEAFYKTIKVEGCYGNRLGKGNPEDKDVTIIRFEHEGKLAAAAMCLSCHPTVLGADNLDISGDLFGYLSTLFYQKYHVYPLMIQGAAGDMSNRNYRQGHDLLELERTGNDIAAQIFASDSGFAPLHLAKPAFRQYSYKNEHCLDLAEWQRLRNEMELQLDKETAYDKRKILKSALMGIDNKIAHPNIKVDFQAVILTLGDLEICQIPGELFSHFGKQIKAASKAKLPLIWGYANGNVGYIADELLYGKTYECTMSPFVRGEANKIVDELACMMRGTP